jgi:predicted secreted Zn-dependent protease
MLHMMLSGNTRVWQLSTPLILPCTVVIIPSARRKAMPALKPTTLTLAAVLAAVSSAAGAGTVATTRYDYYLISGGSAVELYDAMLRRGPHVDGDKAYAATSATSSQQGKLVGGQSCRIADYSVKIDFVIRLPKLRDPGGLTAEERRRFQRFAQFLRRHEETHRSIWLDCAAKLERKVANIEASTCAQAEAKSERLWKEMRSSCSLRHQAFDAADQKRLLQHPFVRYVLNRKVRDTNAAAVP